MSNNEPTLEEIKNIIDVINEGLGEEAWEVGIGVVLRYESSNIAIYLGDIFLWDDVDDRRDYVSGGDFEETEEREDLQGYLECKILRIASLLLRFNRHTQ